jgi:norsolorinic acid ketoreductase
VRDLETSTPTFKDIPQANRGSLILVKIDSKSETDALNAVDILRTKHNITKVDLLIANAGLGNAYDAAAETPLQSLTEHFRVNAGGPLLLFQAFRPLLLAASGSAPKFVVLSSAIASLTDTGLFPLKSTAYGASKAAANFIAQRIHVEEEWLTTFPISPG